jgi:hypothetical protein
MLWNDPKHRGPVKRGPRIPYNGGARDPYSVRLIVIHDTEGGTAMGVARWGANQRNASWHCTVDDNEVVRSLEDGVVAWAAPGANTDGLQLEICGYAKWSKLQWFRRQATLKRSAWQVARWCVKYGIPPRWLSDKQLRDKVSEGLITHAQCSKVFGGSSHWDPGPGFPKGYFIWLVKRRVKWLKAGR